MKKLLVGLLGLLFVFALAGCGGDEASDTVAPEQQTESTDATTTDTDTAADDSATVGQKNALKSANTYLGLGGGGFSYSGLIEQIKFEGYSEEEAAYAADNCGADWNEQAAQKAQTYMDVSSFSREGLIEQLKFEGFTDEQAEYGATAVGY